MRLLAHMLDGEPVIVDVDHDAIRAALTPAVVEGLLPTLAGHPGELTITVPARIISTGTRSSS